MLKNILYIFVYNLFHLRFLTISHLILNTSKQEEKCISKLKFLYMQFLAWRNVVLRMLQNFQKILPLREAGFAFKMEKATLIRN